MSGKQLCTVFTKLHILNGLKTLIFLFFFFFLIPVTNYSKGIAQKEQEGEVYILLQFTIRHALSIMDRVY